MTRLTPLEQLQQEHTRLILNRIKKLNSFKRRLTGGEDRIPGFRCPHKISRMFWKAEGMIIGYKRRANATAT